MDTAHLKAFLRIVEAGSISRAAELLGIAQPSLSQQLLRLEDEIGFTLFRRSARGVALTEAGRVFLEHARQILRDAEQALSDVRQLESSASGEVRLAMPHTVCKMIGVDLVEALLRDAPEIRLKLAEAFGPAIRSGLESGSFDLAVLHDRNLPRHLSARRLLSEEIFLVGPPGRFGASPELAPMVTASQLDGFGLIIPGDQFDLRHFFDREAARLGFSYRLLMEVEAVGLVIELIARGHGWSVLPLPAIEDALGEGQVSIARIGDGSVRRTLCVVRNRAQVVTHASVIVEDAMTRMIARSIASGRWSAELHTGSE